MREMGVLEAKTAFSAIVAEVERTGEDVVITRYGKAAVRITRAGVVDADTDVAAVVSRILRRLDVDVPATSAEEKAAELADLLDRDRSDRW